MPDAMVLIGMLPEQAPRRSGRRPCNTTGSLQLLRLPHPSQLWQGCSNLLLHSLPILSHLR